jgi:hypothetical protein
MTTTTQEDAMTTITRSECCNETLSRPTPGEGPWYCDNCGTDQDALAAQFAQGVEMGRNLAPSERLFARVRGNLARARAADQPLRIAYNRGICKGLGITETQED